MSNQVFPTLPGLSWSIVKAPEWSTRIQKSVSGKELRAALMAYPIYKITLPYEFLRASTAYAELQTLMGFFNARQGSFDSFLFTDTTDSSVTNESFGTGNGVTTAFQLIRAYGGFTEPVMNLNGLPVIKKAGTTMVSGSDYTIDAFGMVTFATPPASAAALTWTGTYYYRCRFDNDSSDFENFMYQLWTLKKLTLRGCLGSKI
jgi:uncharacterized protein (TIGR02217 family)